MRGGGKNKKGKKRSGERKKQQTAVGAALFVEIPAEAWRAYGNSGREKAGWSVGADRQEAS